MTDEERSLPAIERAAVLLPLLSSRLTRHALGEIEVRHGDFRMRAAGRPVSSEAPPEPQPAAAPAPGPATPPATADHARVRAPAVGFFMYADGLGPGMELLSGDSLGYVEMLGVRHDVRAPDSGTVRHLVAESGEAVEYGQVLVEIERSAEDGK